MGELGYRRGHTLPAVQAGAGTWVSEAQTPPYQLLSTADTLTGSLVFLFNGLMFWHAKILAAATVLEDCVCLNIF